MIEDCQPNRFSRSAISQDRILDWLVEEKVLSIALEGNWMNVNRVLKMSTFDRDDLNSTEFETFSVNNLFRGLNLCSWYYSFVSMADELLLRCFFQHGLWLCDHITSMILHMVWRRKFNYRWRGFQIPVSLPWSELVGVEGHPATKNSLQNLWVNTWLMAIFPIVVL